MQKRKFREWKKAFIILISLIEIDRPLEISIVDERIGQKQTIPEINQPTNQSRKNFNALYNINTSYCIAVICFLYYNNKYMSVLIYQDYDMPQLSKATF